MSRAVATLRSLANPSREEHYVPGDRRDVDVVRFVLTFDLVEILAPRIGLRCIACDQQLPQLFDCIRCVFARILDACSFPELDLHTFCPFCR